MILNLTQHTATPEQREAGVFDVADGPEKERVIGLLTFNEIPCPDEIERRAWQLALYATHGGWKKAMIGGAPYFMGPLAKALKILGVEPLFAFSRRESAETVLPDGSIRKTAIFRHIGFVEG